MVRKTCFFITFSFEYLKCWLDIIKKNTEDFKKRFTKSIKIFLTKRKIKRPQYAPEQYRNLSEEREKQKIST